MVRPELLVYAHAGETPDQLSRGEQVACALVGFIAAVAVFWVGYSAVTGALSVLGLLAGTGLVAGFFAIWGLSWAATEHVACRRRQ